MRSQKASLVDPNTQAANALATKIPQPTLEADALATKSDPITLVADALATKSPQALLRPLRFRLTSIAATKGNLRDWSSTPQYLKVKMSSLRTTLSRISLACTRGRRHEQTPKGFRRNVRYSRIHSVIPPYSVSFHNSVFSNGSSGIDFVKPVVIESLIINLGKLALKPTLLAVSGLLYKNKD
jgi:hypothetical protein